MPTETTPATSTSGSTTPLCGHCGRPVINTPAVVYGGVAYHTECTRSPYAADEIERLRAERDEAISAARHLKNLVTSPLTEEDKEWARETMSDTIETLSFSTRDADGVLVLDFAGGGCRPASDKEAELLTEIERLRARVAELEGALRDVLDSPRDGNHGKRVQGARSVLSPKP